MKKIIRKFNRPEGYVFIIIVLVSILIQVLSGAFFTSNNIIDILRSMIVPLIYAICSFLAFISTGPDVSFPMIAALSAFLSTQIATSLGGNVPMVFVFFIAMFFGLLMGALNGFIIVRYRFPSLIVTLGTSSIFTGILLGIFEANRMNLPTSMSDFGRKTLLVVQNKENLLTANLPFVFVIVVIIYILVYFLLNRTVFGRGIYAVGGDEISAERAGFNCNKIRFSVFCINGVLAAVAGICYTTMNLKYLPVEFSGAEMTVIAAVILGGTRMEGGVGTLKGCVLGTLLLTMVSNSLTLMGITTNYQKIFVGIIIIAGTALSSIRFTQKKSLIGEEVKENG